VERVEVTPTTYRRICVASLWALGAIIVTGAAVRLSGSGLGCTDWPGCTHNHLVTGWHLHGLVEDINRFFTVSVSIAVVVAVGASLRRVPRRRDLTRWSWVLVGGVAAEIVIGAAVTLSKLSYSVVGIHFLVSMGLVGAAVILVDLASRADDAPPRPRRPTWAKGLVGLATLVLLSGPVVTSSGPHAGSADVKRLPLNLTWAARIHSTTVWLLIAALIAVAWRYRYTGTATHRRIMDLLVVAIMQGAIGYTQYFTGVPAALVELHVLGATLVWVMTLRFVLAIDPAEQPATAKPPVAVPT
jgi:cytochrome c oxidase assembly protein subunit 15